MFVCMCVSVYVHMCVCVCVYAFCVYIIIEDTSRHLQCGSIFAISVITNIGCMKNV